MPLTNVSRLPVCEDCLASIVPLSGELCRVCGERLATPFLVNAQADLAKCEVCRRAAPPYTQAVAYGSYDRALRELIHLLKYSAILPAAKVLGRLTAEAMARIEPNLGLFKALVIPIPLYSAKSRQRGFNQAELIAKAALKVIGNHRFEFAGHLLHRTRATQSQIGLSSHQRRENLRGAFAVTNPDAIKGREIVLIDDVLTTGTTVSECARVLRRAGASKVWVVTTARTLKLSNQQVTLGEPTGERVQFVAAS